MKTLLPNRSVIAIGGEDRIVFLQGLITNDVTRVTGGMAIYACLLTAQGRFLHDFFVAADGDRLLLECEADRHEDLMRRLKMFRLRMKVDVIDESGTFHVIACYNHHGTGEDLTNSINIAFADPRHAALGTREIIPNNGIVVDDSCLRDSDAPFEQYDRLRISLGVPDGSRDMEPEKALPLENNIDRLNGIAWGKGCYIGQELTARMHYKAVLKKRLVPVRLDGPPVPVGTMLSVGDAEAGEMRSSCGDIGLALLRLDMEGEIRAGETVIKPLLNSSNPQPVYDCAWSICYT